MDLLSTGVTALWFYYLLEKLLCGYIIYWNNCSVVLLSTGVTALWFYYLLE